ncbi:Long-chain-fatty-acid--CoA ligase FadD15 [compost metagenome]
MQALTGLNLYQGYGMTKCTGGITLPNLQQPSISRSAGHISGDVEVRIDGDHGFGEICVQGPAVFPGYLGQSEAPLIDGWLRTGDLGHLE